MQDMIRIYCEIDDECKLIRSIDKFDIAQVVYEEHKKSMRSLAIRNTDKLERHVYTVDQIAASLRIWQGQDELTSISTVGPYSVTSYYHAGYGIMSCRLHVCVTTNRSTETPRYPSWLRHDPNKSYSTTGLDAHGVPAITGLKFYASRNDIEDKRVEITTRHIYDLYLREHAKLIKLHPEHAGVLERHTAIMSASVENYTILAGGFMEFYSIPTTGEFWFEQYTDKDRIASTPVCTVTLEAE